LEHPAPPLFGCSLGRGPGLAAAALRCRGLLLAAWGWGRFAFRGGGSGFGSPPSVSLPLACSWGAPGCCARLYPSQNRTTSSCVTSHCIHHARYSSQGGLNWCGHHRPSSVARTLGPPPSGLVTGGLDWCGDHRPSSVARTLGPPTHPVVSITRSHLSLNRHGFQTIYEENHMPMAVGGPAASTLRRSISTESRSEPDADARFGMVIQGSWWKF
jgi:hypothetical protein